MYRIQLLVLVLMLVTIVIVSAENKESSQIHTRSKQKAKQIRGHRRLALPLDIELDDDWDWTIRAPKDDPHIHNPGKAGKAGKSGKNNNLPINIETQPPSKINDSGKPNKGNSNDSNPSTGKDNDEASFDDDLTNLYRMPSESPSARPSQSPARGPSPQLIGIIPHPPTQKSTIDANFPKAPQLPTRSDVESSVSNNATAEPTLSNSGMMVGVAVSSVGLIAVAMFLVKKRRRKRLVLTASELEDNDMEQGAKRRRIVKDGVVEEDDYIDDGRGQAAAMVSSTFQQAPASPGPLSPPTNVRDGVVEEDEEDSGTFTGVYKLREHYNFSAFLEATGVPWAIRSAAARARPVHFITHQGNVITMKFKGVPRATYILDGPAVENVLRDRTFACKATYTTNNLGFEVEQQGVDNGDYDIRLRWTLSGDDMTVHLTMTAIFKPDPRKNRTREPIMCTQVYHRIGEF